MKVLPLLKTLFLFFVFVTFMKSLALAVEGENVRSLVVKRETECERSRWKPKTLGEALGLKGDAVPPWPAEKTLQLAREGNVKAILVIADCLWDRKSTIKEDVGSKRVDMNLDVWFKVREVLDQKAIVWYEKAIDLKSVNAMQAMAANYLDRYDTFGSAYSADRERAVSLYKKAAENGDIPSIKFLWNVYIEGRYVIQDYREAYRYLNLGAEAGDAATQYSLGVFLSEGKGYPADLTNAYKWFILAQYLGWGNDNKDKIQERMTPEEVLKGQMLAREWLLKNGHSAP